MALAFEIEGVGGEGGDPEFIAGLQSGDGGKIERVDGNESLDGGGILRGVRVRGFFGEIRGERPGHLDAIGSALGYVGFGAGGLAGQLPLQRDPLERDIIAGLAGDLHDRRGQHGLVLHGRCDRGGGGIVLERIKAERGVLAGADLIFVGGLDDQANRVPVLPGEGPRAPIVFRNECCTRGGAGGGLDEEERRFGAERGLQPARALGRGGIGGGGKRERLVELERNADARAREDRRGRGPLIRARAEVDALHAAEGGRCEHLGRVFGEGDVGRGAEHRGRVDEEDGARGRGVVVGLKPVFQFGFGEREVGACRGRAGGEAGGLNEALEESALGGRAVGERGVDG